MIVQITETQNDVVARARRVMTPNYKPQPVVFTQGEGAFLYDREQRRYLDFAGGIAVCCLGHGHPVLANAIAEQAKQLLHVSNLYFNQMQIELAEKLVSISFADRVFFCNSGAEANEAAMKLARRYMQTVRKENRWKFVCAHHSFHGRTWAAISATGQPHYHEGFGPLVPGFVHVPFGNLEAMDAVIDEETCAILVEPVQGEGGVLAPDPAYLAGLRAIADKHRILLILDEVQTGVGRTGKWFAHEHSGVTPDIMSLAKGLAGGVPIGAMLCTEEVSKGFAPGAHASTFGGNPLACRAGLTVLKVIEQEGLLSHVERVGAHLREGLAELSTRIPGLTGARGMGLLAGVGVDPKVIDRAANIERCRNLGLLLTQAGSDALRLTPPYIVSRSQVDDALGILERALNGEGATP
jgi:predicted acetylornithine/succinylornithine family transaminase